jgi:hypothetical protein
VRKGIEMSGKGSAPRPFSDRSFYESEHERIFGKKNKEGQGESQPEVKNDEPEILRIRPD